MFGKVFSFIKRPFVGDQTTGRLVYQRSQGLAYSGINGNGGQGVRRSLNAINPANIAVGPTERAFDPTITGNPSDSLGLQSLSEDTSSI